MALQFSWAMKIVKLETGEHLPYIDNLLLHTYR